MSVTPCDYGGWTDAKPTKRMRATHMYPRIVNKMLMKKSALQPRSRNTPRGGSTTAKLDTKKRTKIVRNGLVWARPNERGLT